MAWSKDAYTTDTPSAALSDKLKDLCGSSGVKNWSFVENVPAGTGGGQSGSNNYSVDVFKCAGTGDDANSAGIDFYVAIHRQVASPHTAFVMRAFELYSPTTEESNKGMCAAPTGGDNATIVIPDPTTFRFDYTSGNPNWRTFEARRGNANAYGSYWSVTLANNGFTGGWKLTNDYVLFHAYSGTIAMVCFAGLLESSVNGTSDPMPLVMFGGNGATDGGGMSGVVVANANGAFSRLPGVTSQRLTDSGLSGVANNNVWGCHTQAVTSPLLFGRNTANSNDFWLGNTLPASRITVVHKMLLSASSVVTWPSQIGWLRGILPASLLATGVSASSDMYNTTTIGANDDWTVVGPAYSAVIDGYSAIITRAV